MTRRRVSHRLLPIACFLGLLAAPLAANPTEEFHGRLVRLDREVQAAFAALSLGAPAPAPGALHRLTGELAALEREIAATPATSELAAKCRLLLARARELEASARTPSSPATRSGRPLPRPFVGGSDSRLPPPGNDACAQALPILANTAVTGSLSQASNDGQATCGSSLFAPDVWYRFDPTDYGSLSLDTLGSNFDTVLALYPGCPGTLANEDACNDDGLGLASGLSFYSYPGEPVWIRVAGYGGDVGSYQLRLGTGGAISGTVRAADTGAPLAGVSVALSRAGSSYTEYVVPTAADGSYTVGGIAAGLYHVWTRATGDYLATPHGGCPNGADSCAVTAAPTVALGAAGTLGGVDIAMRHGASLAGRVTRSSTGAGLPNVALVAWNPTTETSVATAQTDGGGAYRLTPLPSGNFTIYTSTSDLVDEAWPNLSCAGAYSCGNLGTPIAVAPGAVLSGFDFGLDQLGALSGRVTSTAGVGLASAYVEIFSAGGNWLASTYTDAAGQFSHGGFPAGSYRALAHGSYGSGFSSELYQELPCDDCDPTTGTPIAVALNATTPNVNFTLSPLGSLSGRVTSTGGSGLGGVWLHLFSSSGYEFQSVLTDANGFYLFPSVAAGSYFLRTENTFGWLDELFDDRPCGPRCDVTTGTPLTIRDGEASLAHFSLGPGAVLSGTVTETGTGAGLGEGAVRLWDTQGALVREISQPTGGSFVFSGLAAGTYTLSTTRNPEHRDELFDNLPCEPSCAVTAGTPIVLAAGASANRAFVLDRLGAITGSVTAEDSGQPLSYWQVQLYSESGSFLQSTSTSAAGGYRFDGLAPGSYRVLTSNYGSYVDELYANRPCEPTCTVGSGTPVLVTGSATTSGIHFALAPFGHVRGTVRDATTGLGVGGAFVEAVGLTLATSTYGYSNSDGTYDLTVPPGSWAVFSQRGGYSTELWQEQSCPLDNFGDPLCDPALATPVPVAPALVVSGIDFTLTPNGSLSGSVTDAQTGAGIDSRVSAWTFGGVEVGYGYTGPNGVFTIENLAPGTYYLTTDNFDGYLDELWSDLPCLNGPPYGCKVRRGTPVVVTSHATTRNLHLRLERFGGPGGTGIAGQVVDGATGAPLPGITIDAWSSSGQPRGTAVTGPNGSYRLEVSGGPVYVSTDNSLGFVNQVWTGIACPGGSAYSGACDPTTGTPVPLPATGGIDFELLPPTAIFSDGFESGTWSAWSTVVP